MRQNWPVEHELQWQRRARLCLRALARADLRAMEWLAAAGGVAAEPWPAPPEVGRLVGASSNLQVAVEVDQQLVGALLGGLGAPPEPVAHPWSRRAQPAQPAHPCEDALRTDLPDSLPPHQCAARSPFTQVLYGRGCLFAPALTLAQRVHILRIARLAAARQLGCTGSVSRVYAANWADWRAHLRPEAWVQQVHAGGIIDAALAPYLAAGYLIRGFYTDGDALEVVLQWVNRAH